MTEAQLFELLGRKQAQIEQLTNDYIRLVAVVRGVKDDSVSLDRLTIHEDGRWELAAGTPE